MGFIAIWFLVIELILMLTGRGYFQFDSLVIVLTFILMFDVIYLGVTRKLTHMYETSKKWFKGEVIENESWNNLLVNVRKILVVNYLVSFSIMIVFLIINILVEFTRFYMYMPFQYSTYLIKMVIVYNGIFMGPIYLLLGRKVKK